uniref:Uncharacterized protein n=1 Tax=Aegilops tauschii subsp. strangulata TaxID=200361 RepID=A0A453HFZ4_AEGTS
MFTDHYMFCCLLLNSQKNHAFASPSCGTTRPDPIISENMYYVYGSLHVLVEQG